MVAPGEEDGEEQEEEEAEHDGQGRSLGGLSRPKYDTQIRLTVTLEVHQERAEDGNEKEEEEKRRQEEEEAGGGRGGRPPRSAKTLVGIFILPGIHGLNMRLTADLEKAGKMS